MKTQDNFYETSSYTLSSHLITTYENCDSLNVCIV